MEAVIEAALTCDDGHKYFTNIRYGDLRKGLACGHPGFALLLAKPQMLGYIIEKVNSRRWN